MTRHRFSIPYFVSPKRDTLMVPLEGTCIKSGESKYKAMPYNEFVEQMTEGFFPKDGNS